jgi:hypothetical protein
MSLVRNAAALGRIRKLWSVVRRLAELQPGPLTLPNGVLIKTPAMPDEFYNLPVVLAVSALEEALEAARNEGAFRAPGGRLGEIMDASRQAIAWKDFSAVDHTRARRNDIAHEGVLFGRAECLQMIAHIEAELEGWGVIP